MAKPNVKALVIEKGEKFALMGAGVLMLIFAILGVLELSDPPDTDKFVQDVNKHETKVTTEVNAPADPKDYGTLPKEVTTPITVGPVVSKWPNHLFFDPIAPPDKRRINPTVLPIAEVQADFMWTKVLAYDMRETADGGKLLGVVNASAKDKIDTEKLSQQIKEQTQRFSSMTSIPRRNGGDNPPPKNAPPAAPEIEVGGQRDEVEYLPLPLDPEKLTNKRYALTILPRRMMIVQASFPYKQQIEEIQKALRLDKPSDVFDVYKPEETPRFLGVLVQRQVMFPDGKVEIPWTDLDVFSNYKRVIYPRKYLDKPDDLNTLYVLLPNGHRLTMPLPLLLSGKYPDIRMSTIQETIKRLVALNKPPERPRTLTQQEGGGDIFEPIRANATSASGQPNSESLSIPKGLAGKELDKEDAPSPESKFQEIPDNILIRLIDDDIEPGRLYQYRLKMLMQNPNWIGPKDKKGQPQYPEKKELVSKPSDVQVMILGADVDDEPALRARFGLRKDEDPVKNPFKLTDEDLKKCLAAKTEWTELKASEAVSVPREDYLFATDPPVDAKNKSIIPLKTGQGVLQIQRWLPIATIDNKYKEPVADWVIADVVATRGTYLGGKQLVNLPIWSSKVNKYVLRVAEPERGKTTVRRGVYMDPTKPGPQYVVADVEGGVLSNRPLTRSVYVDDDTAAQVLLLDENGGIQVRSAYADRADAGRASRDKAWRAWIEQTEKDPQSLPAEANPQKKKDGFD